MGEHSIIKNAVLLGYECNLNCIFCYAGDKRGKYEPMTTEETKREIKEGKKRGADFLDLLGGEPTIRPDILELINYGKGLGYDQIAVTTNGQMMGYKDFAEKIVNAGLNHIIFSIHGPNAKIHDFHTRVKGSYERIIQGVKNVTEISDPGEVYLCSNTVMTKKNIDLIPEIIDKVGKLGFDGAEIIFPHPRGNAWKNFEKIVPYLKDVESIVDETIEASKKYKLREHCMFRYVPMCYMNGRIEHLSEYMSRVKEQHVGPEFQDLEVEKGRKEVGKVKAEKCKRCKYYEICEGVWKEYAEKRGTSELKPITEA